jgi:endonuclease/exonuclease/phosphatase family metal-dependent hydrolase
MQTLNVATYNIHKGLSYFNQRVVLFELRDRLHELNADIVFLQEVQGAHRLHHRHFSNYPDEAQHEFIADKRWPHAAYGMNAVYAAGHHGNAVLSRYPILRMINTDISAHRFESRGLLHCEIALPQGCNVHCLCVHFSLFAKGRRTQTARLIEYVKEEIPGEVPVIIAGDFNDWRNQLSVAIERELNMRDVFSLHGGKLARSFPARLPMFRLDRIYMRGFSVQRSEVHVGGAWQRLSDHAALSASLMVNACTK